MTILHEDEDYLFVDKPARVMSVPAPDGRAADRGTSVVERLREQGIRVRAVHRLDYETSGVMLFAKTEAAEHAAHAAFRARTVEKTYLALVEGWPRPFRGKIDYPIKDLGASAVISKEGKEAVTFYQVIDEQGPCSLVSCRIPTGRHNQIRIHFAQIGHPLVGERKFSRGKDAVMTHKRALLHAVELVVPSPRGGDPITVKSPLPADFKNALEKARSLPSRLHHAIDREATRGKAPGSRSRLRRGNPGRRKGKNQRPPRRGQ
ncbi:MAG: RluA family pseudouridine synthase [Planctomycetota bacterium]